MHFCYVKSFDIARARQSGIPRISSVNLQTFGQYTLIDDVSDIPSPYTIAPTLHEGLQDFISYGLEQLKNVEFSDIADGEVQNFERVIANDIQNICEQYDRATAGECNRQVVRSLNAVMNDLASRMGLEENPGFMVMNAPVGIGSLKDFARNLITTINNRIRRMNFANYGMEVSYQITRPLVGEVTLQSSAGFQHASVNSIRIGPSMETLMDPGLHIGLNGVEVDLDNRPSTRRYVRYVQYLAHKYSPYRLQVRVDERLNQIFIRPLVEQSHVIEGHFERYRPHMPDNLPENLTLAQKLVAVYLTMATMSNIAPRWNVNVTEEMYATLDINRAFEVLGRFALEVHLESSEFQSAFIPYMKGLTEVVWTLSKLKWSHLQSTSLNFPELATFLQPASPAPSTV